MLITSFGIRPLMEISPSIFRETFTPIPRNSRRILASFSQEIPNSQLPALSTSPKPLKFAAGKNNNQIGEENIPTMAEILAASKTQNLDLRLQTLGPFFRITAKNLETQSELGKAEGVIRAWFGGKILHLDSIRLRRESLSMRKSIFGLGLFIGAVAIRYGYDRGCRTAELLAINDSDLYHSKLVRFYRRIGFKAVREVNGSRLGDLGHMLVWGGIGTRMDADIQALLTKCFQSVESQTCQKLCRRLLSR